MSKLDNLEPIVDDDTEDMAIDANTNDVDVNMATGAYNDAKKLTDDLRRYFIHMIKMNWF